MDYRKLYNNIITNARHQTRSKNIGYFERHHIVPRCLKGDNSKDNLVLLTAREHFIVHMILIEMYPINSYEWHKLVNAASSFIRKSKNHQRHVMSARQYERIKILLSESKKGKPRPQSVKDKISKTKQKNPYIMNDTHRKILSNRMQGQNNPMYGNTHSAEAREKISNARKGKPNLYVSESNRRRIGTQTKSTRSVVQLSIDGIVIAAYISIAEAKRQTGINMIGNAVRGNQKTAGGFIWNYQEN